MSGSGSRRFRKWSHAIGLVSVLLLLIAGCLGGPSRQSTEDPTRTETTLVRKPPSGLESVLYRLVRADDRSAFATEHGLQLRDDSVLVVIELEPDKELPETFELDVESRYQNRVQAFVAIEDLATLAAHENVSFVRPPQEPVQHDTTTQ